MEQIKEFLANFDFKALVDKILAFINEFVAKLTGGTDVAE